MATVLAGGALDQNPVGMILLWNKTTRIPRNWRECDGQSGRPDLRNKFLKQVPNNVTNPGAIGGVETVTLDLTTLGAHVHRTITNSHRHTWSITRADSGGGGARYQGAGDIPFFPDLITEEVQQVSSVQFEGGDGSHNNIPQFNESFYIIKVSG